MVSVSTDWVGKADMLTKILFSELAKLVWRYRTVLGSSSTFISY